MAGGAFVTASGKHYDGKFTLVVFLACFVAAFGGLIFGYDVGISGGVTSMDSFLLKFFPKVLRDKKDRNNYCQFNSQVLQIFTSSLYLAGLAFAFAASFTTQKWGRRCSMWIAGLFYMLGAALGAAALNLEMLILGRLLLGVGVGFANQSVPLYLSEMAPSKWRGACNNMFQLFTTVGILVANLVNFGTEKLEWGWRISLGLAAVAGAILFLGGFFLDETPNSLIERGQTGKGKLVLKKIRGTPDVDDEYEDILEASLISREDHNPLLNLLKRRNRPQLAVAILIPMFQQLTGINAIMFYAPVLFKTIGFGNDAALYSSIITGGVMVACTLVSIAVVDRLGRRVLFLVGGVQMLICQIAIGLILNFELPITVGETLPKAWANLVVALICLYVGGFAWSWGPLGWLVPSEVFPLEIRSAAQSVTVSCNFLFTFAVGQVFLTLLCDLKWGTFLFFATWVLIMTLYIYFFLPETKGIPIEEMTAVWGQHWFWRKYIQDSKDVKEEGKKGEEEKEKDEERKKEKRDTFITSALEKTSTMLTNLNTDCV